MKVVQILPRMDLGGVERGVLDLVRYFKDKGIASVIVSGGGRLTGDLEKEGAKHYRLPVYKKSVFSLFLISRLRKIIGCEEADIIHARSRVPAWISFFASRKSRTNFITTAHGVYRNRYGSEVMGWGKFVICPSRVVAKHMRTRFGVPEDKIIIVNRWVDLNRFKFTRYKKRKNSNVIVSIGRISPSKGYEYLIEAIKKVIRFNPYIVCKIVGSAEGSKVNYLNHLKTLVNRFSLNYNIHFLGFQKNVENILKQARLLVAPSLSEESFGRVIVEAYAAGVPVIATKAGGFKEIIEDGRDGILVDPKDPQAIADNILRLLSNHNLAEEMAVKAQEKVKNLYTMEKCLAQTAQVYKKTQSFLRILVVKVSSLGDLILSFPSLRAIREHFPAAKVSLLTSREYAQFIYDCPYLDEIITLEKSYKRIKSIRRLARDLRRKSFDYIIDLQNNYASHLISFLAFPRYSFGYSLRAGSLLTNRIKYDRRDSPLISQEKVLKLAGVTLKEKELVFWEQRHPSKTAFPAGDLIGINISASNRWRSKNWPLKNIIRLIELIGKSLPFAKVILIGGRETRAKAEKIEAAAFPRPLNLCGKIPLEDLPALIKKMKVFITPDTAALHLAQSCSIPTLALFGPTNPFRHTVKSSNLFLFYKEIPCSFCYRSRCRLKEENLCMEMITPQEVLSKIRKIAVKS